MDIVVCGGGTAGWLSAYIIATAQPNIHNITVIESTKIGIVGAGEASSGLLYDLLVGSLFVNNNAIFAKDPKILDVEDFMDKVDAIPKYALNHINWAKEKGSYFAPIFGPETSGRNPDVLFNYCISEFGLDKAHLSHSIGLSYEMNKMPMANGHGFHFDAFKVGKYLRNFLIENVGITHIDSTITKVDIESSGTIQSVRLEDGRTISGDFFIDCTGFSRVLIKNYDLEWISYKKYLPVDSAMPFLMQYDDLLKEKVEPVTTAEALSSGWMWRTPLQSRKGCGYVYSSDFISEDDAQREAEKIVGREIEPLKHLKFDSGRLEKFWVKNCLVTGLAASFIEPLEATSIHATIMQMLNFTQEFLTPHVETTVSEYNCAVYNRTTEKMYDFYRDFVVLHYQGGREDSEFWRYIKNDRLITPVVEEYIEKAKFKIPSTLFFQDIWGVDHLWKWSLAGLGLVTREQARQELEWAGMDEYADGFYKEYYDYNIYFLTTQMTPFEVFPRGQVALTLN